MMQPEAQSQTNNEQAAKYNIQLGLAYLKQGDVERAKLKLNKAIEQDPKLPEAYTAMAYFQMLAGNMGIAEDYYKKAVSLAPANGETHNIYGGFLCVESRYKEAEQEYLKAVADPHYVAVGQAYENAGWCALSAKDNAKAIYYFRQAVKNDPNRSGLLEEVQRLETMEPL